MTSNQLLAPAREMTGELSEAQEATEHAGQYDELTHARFITNHFYRVLQPRRFGGLELDVRTFFELIAAIAEGCPSTAWGLSMASAQALVVASRLSESVQAEVFGVDGDFRAPHQALPSGQARAAAGGYVVDGVWDHCSGMTYATHFMATVPVLDTQPPRAVVVTVPRAQVTLLNDQPRDAMLGLRGSGARSVHLEKVFVAEDHTLGFPYGSPDLEGAAPGTKLHRSPMYLGRLYAFYHGRMAAVVVGTAKAALNEYERMLRTKKTLIPPRVMRYQDTSYQRSLGLATALTDSAEGLLIYGGEKYGELCQKRATQGRPFSAEDDVRLFGVLAQAARLAADASELLFQTASSSAARTGERLERYFRDTAMYRSHFAAQYRNLAAPFARVRLGLEADLLAGDGHRAFDEGASGRSTS